MGLRKGDNVEVMKKAEKLNSWHPAQILSGNGYTYRVQYCNLGMASKQIDTVSRKFVRPCPPTVLGAENHNVGDVVEVFYECVWKAAAVMKILEMKNRKCLVRLLGCSMEIIVDGSNIRMRQSWQDGEWILIGKSSRGGENVIVRRMSTANQKTLQNNAKTQMQKDAFWDSQMISSRSLKRMSPYSSSIIEACNGHAQRLRAIEKDGGQQRVVAARGEISCNKSVFTPFKIGYNQMERAEPRNVLSSDSNACSVGSCSINDQNPKNFCIPFIPLLGRQSDTRSSDAESCIGPGHERESPSLLLKEEVEISIHWLELHAYRRTLKALYASGPLSWDQEALLTNLRIVLHISNDEHLMELKELASDRTATNVR